MNVGHWRKVSTVNVTAVLEGMSLETIPTFTDNEVSLDNYCTDPNLSAPDSGELGKIGIGLCQIEETLVAGSDVHGSHAEIIPP
jgi:hypothetical protein